MKIKKTLLLVPSILLTSFSVISAPFFVTSCSTTNPFDLSNIIKKTNKENDFINPPTEAQIWEWVADNNPQVDRIGLTYDDLIFSNDYELTSCDITANELSKFTGHVVITYTVADQTDIANVITDTNVGEAGSDTPDIGELWEMIVEENPTVATVNLTVGDLNFSDPTEKSCILTAKDESSFHGTVTVTYNTKDPELFCHYRSGGETQVNVKLTSLKTGLVTVDAKHPFFDTYWTFGWFDDAYDEFRTQSYGATSPSGYHYANLQYSGYKEMTADLCTWNNQVGAGIDVSNELFKYGLGTHTYRCQIDFNLVVDGTNALITPFTIIFTFYTSSQTKNNI